MEVIATEVSGQRVESGDPMLKRLVDLAHLGWRADLLILTNGVFLSGTLISPQTFRNALAESIQARADDTHLAGLDSIVARAVAAEEPPPDPRPLALDAPEPRFIHLRDVRVGFGSQVTAPYLRLRLPAVSGFWLTTVVEPDREDG